MNRSRFWFMIPIIISAFGFIINNGANDLENIAKQETDSLSSMYFGP